MPGMVHPENPEAGIRTVPMRRTGRGTAFAPVPWIHSSGLQNLLRRFCKRRIQETEVSIQNQNERCQKVL